MLRFKENIKKNIVEWKIELYDDNSIYCGNEQHSVHHDTTYVLRNINVLE
jgi:hypothetical protein